MFLIFWGDMHDEMDVRNWVCRDAINRVSTDADTDIFTNN